MTHFNRPLVHAVNRIASITNAYAHAGLSFENPGAAFSRQVATAPAPEDILREAAEQAITADDPAAHYEEALARYRDAISARQFRADIQGHLSSAITRNLSIIVAQAVEDLTPAFNADATTLTNAAKKLAYPDPFNPDQAIAHDSTKAYKEAKATLARLSVYAGLWETPTGSGGEVPNHIAGIIGIVGLPENIVQEERQDLGAAEGRTVTHPEEMAPTLTFRRFSDDARSDIDCALLGLARGDYEGMKLALATPEERTKRAALAAMAHTYKSVVATSAKAPAFLYR